MPVLSNAKWEKFAQGLAKGQTADEAYANAGYKPNRHNASRLKTNENIESRVAELVGRGADKAEVTIARVLDEMRKLGFSDLRRAFDDSGRLKLPQEWDDDFAASVASVEVVTRNIGDGEVEHVHKIKVWDKNSALEKIAKHLGMFIERHEHSGPDGGPIQTESRSWREVLRED